MPYRNGVAYYGAYGGGDIALFTIIQTNHNMLLAYYSHKHIFSLFGLL